MASVENDLVITTGNILNGDKKAGRKSTDELLDSLNQCLNGLSNQANSAHLEEYPRSELSIAAKIFLNNDLEEHLDEAINSLLSTLKVEYIDNTVLAYHPQPKEHETADNNSENVGVLKWGSKTEKAVESLKKLWGKLEEHTTNNKIKQIGVSDLDTETLVNLYEGAKIKPSIAQINLSSCCVVPPSLQEFCNKNEVQLLTHSDPETILDLESLTKVGVQNIRPRWVVRYQVHVKCRGLLYAKGYIVGATKTSQ